MKPDWKDAPEWARYLAMDSTGYWFWFEEKPRDMATHWLVYNNGRFSLASEGIDWTKTLEERQ